MNQLRPEIKQWGHRLKILRDIQILGSHDIIHAAVVVSGGKPGDDWGICQQAVGFMFLDERPT